MVHAAGGEMMWGIFSFIMTASRNITHNVTKLKSSLDSFFNMTSSSLDSNGVHKYHISIQ